MNDLFVCIKVDREERPDIDQLFMSASLASRGSGGWPQTVLTTWDLKPFFLASYLPPTPRPGRMGLTDLFDQTEDFWNANRAGLTSLAEDIIEKLRSFAANPPGGAVNEDTALKAFDQLTRLYDPEHGGLGPKQKFPPTHQLSFLLRHWKRTGDPKALEMVEHSLDAMRRGAIHDHLGGGFHRYTTDVAWTTPHFEKMLYDQAMLALTYLEAFQATGNDRHAEVARGIFEFVLRDLTAPSGGFYAALDADSPDGEGRTYVWSLGDLEKALGEADAATFSAAYGVVAEGNYRDQATDELTGLNALRLSEDPTSDLSDLSRKLFMLRQSRPQPPRDDLILTDWNGLMIAALARGGSILSEPRYTMAAERAAAFIHQHLTNESRLQHRHRQGVSGIEAQLDDYAFIVWGLLELYEATFDVAYLKRAIALNATMLERHWDPIDGGLYLTHHQARDLPMRLKTTRDGARPSGNSVAALNFLRTARITGNATLENRAHEIFETFAGKIEPEPAAYTHLLLAHDFATGPSAEVVIAGKPGAEDTDAMLRALRHSFAPNKVVLFRSANEESPAISEIAAFTQNQTAQNGNATAYVCRNYVCRAPTTDPQKMLELLQDGR